MAASIGVGAGGVNLGTRLRVVVIFGLLEAGMPVLGLLIGHGLATDVGREARWLAAGLLVAIGGYGIVSAVRGEYGGSSPQASTAGGSGGSSPQATLDQPGRRAGSSR